MRDLLENGDVNLGITTNIAKAIPYDLAKGLLNEDTGELDALSNELAIKEESLIPGTKSASRLKSIQASKPGLGRTKEQNLKIIAHKLKQIEHKADSRLKQYPGLDEKRSSQLSKQDSLSGPYGRAIKKSDGKVYMWNPEEEDYTIELKKKG